MMDSVVLTALVLTGISVLVALHTVLSIRRTLRQHRERKALIGLGYGLIVAGADGAMQMFKSGKLTKEQANNVVDLASYRLRGLP